MELGLNVARRSFALEPFTISPSVNAFVIGGRTALFCERTQQLAELNPTAARIWRMAAAGRNAEEIAETLCDLGASKSDANAFVDTAVRSWLREGHLSVAAAADWINAEPCLTLTLAVGPLPVDIAVHGDADAVAIAGVFGHLIGVGQSNAPRRIAVVGRDGADFLFCDGAPFGMCASHETPAWVKAKITEALCEHVSDGFLAHGGLVSGHGKRLFITGAPGAGKSTLVLALSHAGFAFCSDDIVHIDNTGRAAGVPFAAAAKAGAWDLLQPFTPSIMELPVYQRADGHQVRYVTPVDRDNGYTPIDVILLLAREPGAAARFEPVDPLDALCAILDSGYSKHHATDAKTVLKLAENLERCSSYRFVYDDLSDATAVIEARIHA